MIGESLHSLEECMPHSRSLHISSDVVSEQVADDAFGTEVNKALMLVRTPH